MTLSWGKRLLCFCGHMVVNLIFFSDAEVSRVCFSTEQNCSTHNLQCSLNRRIGITVARRVNLERSDYTDCTCGRYKCDGCSRSSTVMSRVVNCATPYSTQEYRNLLLDCSFKRNCSSGVPSQGRKECFAADRGSFSEIRFECLSDEQIVDFCNGTGTGTGEGGIKYLSILYRDTSMAARCHCVVKGMDRPSEKYKVKLLDIRDEHTGGGYYTLTFTSDTKISTFGNKTYSQDHRMRMFNGNSSAEVYVNLTVYPGMESPERIWLLIEGSTAITVSCHTDARADVIKVVSSRGTTSDSTFTFSETESSSSSAERTLNTDDPRHTAEASVNREDQNGQGKSSSAEGWMFAAGLVTGMVVVSLVVLLIYIVVVRRLYNIVLKKEHDTPTTTEHPTYAGLSAERDTAGNYDFINNPVS